MKKHFSVLLTLILPLCLSLNSFVAPSGGEGYEIYVDNKLVIRQFGPDMRTVKNLQLSSSQLKSELSVKFFHCGMIGKSRILQLKTPANELLKQWQFANEEAKNFSIAVPVKEIIEQQKKSAAGTLHLYYASQEAPGGRFLAGITTTTMAKTARVK